MAQEALRNEASPFGNMFEAMQFQQSASPLAGEAQRDMALRRIGNIAAEASERGWKARAEQKGCAYRVHFLSPEGRMLEGKWHLNLMHAWQHATDFLYNYKFLEP